MKRDAILCVDGQEILNFGRQSIPTFVPGPPAQFGAVRHDGRRAAVRGRRQGRQARKRQVICLHGDGSFGLNAMELDTAVRHKLPLLVRHQPQRRLDRRPGAQQARPRPRLHPLRQDGRGARLPTANMSRSPRTSARPWSGRRRRSTRAWSRWSTSRPTTAPAPRPCASRAARPELAWPAVTQKGRLRAPFLLAAARLGSVMHPLRIGSGAWKEAAEFRP